MSAIACVAASSPVPPAVHGSERASLVSISSLWARDLNSLRPLPIHPGCPLLDDPRTDGVLVRWQWSC